ESAIETGLSAGSSELEDKIKLRMIMAKPLLFITGFLGAGKTTLLRDLLEELRKHGRSADVILNDYENAEIDAATLPEHTASIAPIAASCACCGSLDDLVQLSVAAQKAPF
ncbi:MAG: GTP-binding protein, partial [Chloroflexota bacterium]